MNTDDRCNWEEWIAPTQRGLSFPGLQALEQGLLATCPPVRIQFVQKTDQGGTND